MRYFNILVMLWDKDPRLLQSKKQISILAQIGRLRNIKTPTQVPKKPAILWPLIYIVPRRSLSYDGTINVKAELATETLDHLRYSTCANMKTLNDIPRPKPPWPMKNHCI